MTPQEAIRILMLSPCYWLLSLPARKQLVREYCSAYASSRPERSLPSSKPFVR